MDEFEMDELDETLTDLGLRGMQPETVEEQLEAQGLRIASEDEPGWYVLVRVSADETGKVWATTP